MALAVIYGAGNIGRGLLGMLLRRSDYDVMFIEADRRLAAMLDERGAYPVRTLPQSGAEDHIVTGVRATCAADTDAAAAAVADADILATAVGAGNLPLIAPVIAEGIRRRIARGCGPLNILICENMMGADGKLAARLAGAGLDPPEIREHTGLIRSTTGRMTPVQTDEMKTGDPLRVSAEAHAILEADRSAFRGGPPVIEGIETYDDFDYYMERKLYVHNMAHATCGFLGLEKGYELISDAIADEDILGTVRAAMRESAAAVSAEHGRGADEMDPYIDDLIRRFANGALHFTCARAASDPQRKLGDDERLLGAVSLCRRHGLPYGHIEKGADAALRRLRADTDGKAPMKGTIIDLRVSETEGYL
jgi:mannitol-1-phosphate 5-dehydrogenase